MYDNPNNPYGVPDYTHKPKRKSKAWRVILCVFMTVAIVLAAAVLLTKNIRKYAAASAMLELAEYEVAAELFSQIPGYRDADTCAKLAKYRYAEQLVQAQQYLDAVPNYEELGDYETSTRRVLDCYYRQGELMLEQGKADDAITYFTKAQGYQDAAERVNEAIYYRGHELFLAGEYQQAEAYFDRLNGQYPLGGGPHFMGLPDAAAYLQQESDQLTERIWCHIAQLPEEYAEDEDALFEVISNYVALRQGYVRYDPEELCLFVEATYYPGNRMVYAWRTGDDSMLSDEEKQVLQLALELVEQAKAESETSLDVERWLYDWLCAHITYENPNMDVEDEAYLQLRQLTCVGALLDGKANCQGYTDAFYLLGTLAGFDVCRIGGISEEPHSWNGILLNEKMYIVDATFGDLEMEGDSAANYVWFNCGFDPEYYEIDGGVQVFPALTHENDLSQSYYAGQETIFESLDEAAYYMLRQYKDNGEGWVYAAIQDTQISSEELFNALDDNMSKAGVWSIQWTEIIEYYGGNTYFAIRWE